MIITLTASATELLAQEIGGVDPSLPTGEAGEKLNMLMSWLMGLCILGAVAGLTICGAKLAVSKISGQGGENGAGLAWGLAGSIVIGAASTLVNMLVL